MKNLQPTTYNLQPIRGFTMTEVIVVVGVLLLLLTVGVGFTQKGGKQIVLFKEHAQLTQQILRARSFATQKLRPENELICGYGISILDNVGADQYAIFKDLPRSGACPGDGVMDANEEVEIFTMDNAVTLFEYNHPEFVFSPRDGFVYFGTRRAEPDQDDAFITLQLKTNDQRLTLYINYIGQVYTE